MDKKSIVDNLPEGTKEEKTKPLIVKKDTGKEHWGVGGRFKIDPVTGRRVIVKEKV